MSILAQIKQFFFPSTSSVSKKVPERLSALAIDIGTEFVKVLVCEPDYTEDKLYIRGVGKQRQRLGDMYNGGIIDIENVLRNVGKAIEEAEMIAGFSSHQVVLGMAGELVKGTTIAVTYSRERPDEKITLPELRNLAHKVQWRAYDQARKELAKETGFNELEIKLVHTSLVDIRIDGYRVANPVGFKGKNVEVSIFNAFAPLVHFDSIESIAEGLGKELLSVVVEPYAVSRVLESEDGGDVSALFIDIGGGSTDVALVQNGGVIATKIYGIGGRVFTKRIAKHFHLPFPEAEKLKLDYASRRLTSIMQSKMEQLVAADVETWMYGLVFSLQDIKNVDTLPSRIYLCGGGALLPEISGALMKHEWFKDLPFIKKPQVAFLSPEHITKVVDTTGILKNQQDITPMALANLTYDFIGEEKIVTKILRQVTKVVST